jgi:TRAP-type C4-dicarboxylate transport system permease large subunit
LTIEQVPAQIALAMPSLTQSAALLKLMMLFILILVGTFLDLTPAVIILTPIFLPIAHQIHMPAVQFGLMMIMALGIGKCTPPWGSPSLSRAASRTPRSARLFFP